MGKLWDDILSSIWPLLSKPRSQQQQKLQDIHKLRETNHPTINYGADEKLRRQILGIEQK